MDVKCEKSKTYLAHSVDNLSNLHIKQSLRDENLPSTSQIEHYTQLILDYGSQKVECARSLIDLLNKAEEEIFNEIKIIESSLAKDNLLHTVPICEVPVLEDVNVEDNLCICRGANVGRMIKCDHPQCPFIWFHLECVGLTKESDLWFCPYCTSLMRKKEEENEFIK